MQEDGEKLNRIEEMKTKLNSRNYEPKMQYHDIFVRHPDKEVSDSWQGQEEKDFDPNQVFAGKTPMFKKFFIFSIIIFVLALGYAAYMFFAGGNTVSNNNIDIAVLGNTFTAGGEDLPLQIEITNRNGSALELADLLVEYPKSSSGDLSGDVERLRDSLGTIPSGGVKTDNMKVVLFGEQGSTRQVRISLEYRVANSNAIFVKEKMFDVSISSAPIDLSLDAPDEVSQNQDLTLKVKAILNATKPASNILVKLDYPVGFQFVSATPAPSLGNNVWNLGDLAPGTERDIEVVGKMVDVSDGEQKTFHVFSGSGSESDKSMIGIVFNSLGHTVTIKRPFIDAKLTVNGVYQSQYAVISGSEISGEINWVNNLDTKVNNLVIIAKLSGNALDRKTIRATQGYYNSSNDTITWDRNGQNRFAEVNPGDSGSVSFSVYPLSLYSASSGMLSSPTIEVNVSISAKQPLEGNQVENLTNSESKSIHVISNVGLAAKGLYYSGAFPNTGPIPPQAEKETTYTIVWTLSNTANNISNAQIRATLPAWAKFKGPVSPPAEDVTFDATTREIVWNIGGIPRGAGIIDTEREVSFQLGVTPSLSQVGSMPNIIGDAVLTGHDDFANVDIRVNKPALNTLLLYDPALGPGGAKVVE